jgi:hypothetical protein
VIRRRQLGIAVMVVAGAVVVLLAAGRAPAVDAGRDRPRPPVVVTVNQAAAHPLTVNEYAAWAGARSRFDIAGRVLSKALGACRMRLGSFHACALPAVSEMAYESDNLAGVTNAFERRDGPCGRALHTFGIRLGGYMDAAEAFARLPNGNPMSALTRLQRKLLTAEESYALAGLRVRGNCRPG